MQIRTADIHKDRATPHNGGESIETTFVLPELGWDLPDFGLREEKDHCVEEKSSVLWTSSVVSLCFKLEEMLLFYLL